MSDELRQQASRLETALGEDFGDLVREADYDEVLVLRDALIELLDALIRALKRVVGRVETHGQVELELLSGDEEDAT